MVKLTGSISKILFIRANALESECLAERDGSFTAYWVATVHEEILVFVHGFNMQVSFDLAIF